MSWLGNVVLAILGKSPERVVTKEVPTVVEREVIVLGTPELTEVYRACDAKYEDAYARWIRYSFVRETDPEPKPADWHGEYYETCAQAFEARPGARVERAQFYRIGDLVLGDVRAVRLHVQPKPKLAKGRK